MNIFETGLSKIKKQADEKRWFNIENLLKLERTTLKYKILERRLKIVENESSKILWNQYPGKETVLVDGFNPLDMRPKITFSGGIEMKDLAFIDMHQIIWENRDNRKALSALAKEFYRMAYMDSYKKVKKLFYYEDVNILTKQVVNSGYIELELYLYNPSKKVLKSIKLKEDTMFGCDIVLLLTYIDWIGQNEAMKYYYKTVIEKGKKWNPNLSRRNMFLHLFTYTVAVLGLISPEDYSNSLHGTVKKGIHYLGYNKAHEMAKLLVDTKNNSQKRVVFIYFLLHQIHNFSKI